MTFQQMSSRATAMAPAFAKAGVREGSLVALALPNCAAFVPALLALSQLSARVALVSPNSGASELQQITQGTDINSIVTASGVSERFKARLPIASSQPIPGAEDGETLEQLFPAEAALSGQRAQSAGTATQPQDTTLLKFTSGSTGEPKGIALSDDNILAEAKNVVDTLSLTPEDRILAPVPVVHSYGFDLGVLGMLFSGAALVLHDSFIPRRILAELSDRGITVFLGVPMMYRALLETHSDPIPRLAHIRYLLSCTAPLNPDLITAFHEKFHAPICQHYGSSETGAITNHRPAEVLNRLTSVGVAMKGVEIRIVDADGKPLAAGAEGQIQAHSAAVASGYVMGRPEGEDPFGAGVFRTADVGVLDAQGFLEVRGRVDELINVGGLKVWPAEVARVLESCPAVRQAGVLGVPDGQGEQMVIAVVTLRGPTTESEILAFCRERLADFKVPRRVEIRDELPAGSGGKVRLRPEGLQQ